MPLDFPLLARLVIFLVPLMPTIASAETFRFGRGQNSFDGIASAAITEGNFTMSLAPLTPGALLTEISSAGLGINSQPVVGTDDSNQAVFNLIGGSGPWAGSGEAIVYSFDRAGILTGFDFDGVKDELLEYFVLESTAGLKIYFFDSSANMPDVPHPIYEHPLDAAIDDGAIEGEVVMLWESNGLFDDEVYGLSIPFTAGQEFTLTFGAIDSPYGQGAANGARLQGITVVAIPEPGAWLLAVAGGLALSICKLRGRKRAFGYLAAKRAISSEFSSSSI